MLVASDAFGDAVKEVYEPEWPGRDKLIQYFEVCGQKILSAHALNYNHLLHNLYFILQCNSVS